MSPAPDRRDESIDFLRFLGLMLIILAHVNPPGALMQARDFDVPMMLVLAGASFGLSYKNEPFLAYLWKRIKRLAFPVWIFMTGYFLDRAAASALPGTGQIIGSYALTEGIGYVWVIRVFLMIAIISPFLLNASRKLPNQGRFFAALFAAYAAYELYRDFGPQPQNGITGTVFYYTVPYLVPYAFLFCLGTRLEQLSRRGVILLGLCAAALCLIYGYGLYHTYGAFVPTRENKYPPTPYYLAYGLALTCLWRLLAPAAIGLAQRLRIMPAILFIGQNTIWIYLWHIPCIESTPEMPWLPRYALTLALAITAAFIQIQLVARAVLPHLGNDRLRKNVRLIFTG